MKRITRIIFLLSLVLILIASMTLTAVAARPQNPGQQGRERAASNNGASEQGASQGNGAVQGEGEISPLAVPTSYTAEQIYNDNTNWVKTGQWVMERYSKIISGGADIMVANGGATVTRTFTKDQLTGGYLRIYYARYWSCGDMRIRLVGNKQGGGAAPFEIFSTDERLRYGEPGSAPDWESYYTSIEIKDPGNQYKDYTLTITALGTVNGGLPEYYYGDPAVGMAFVNVIMVEILDSL